jgi:hypothetical protein
MEQCERHQELEVNVAIIKNDISYIREKVCNHIREGEEKGGYRDRLLVAEKDISSLAREISALKRAEWTRVLVAGAIGGMIGNLTPNAINGILKLFGLF